jgi:hypothetical protein
LRFKGDFESIDKESGLQIDGTPFVIEPTSLVIAGPDPQSLIVKNDEATTIAAITKGSVIITLLPALTDTWEDETTHELKLNFNDEISTGAAITQITVNRPKEENESTSTGGNTKSPETGDGNFSDKNNGKDSVPSKLHPSLPQGVSDKAKRIANAEIP